MEIALLLSLISVVSMVSVRFAGDMTANSVARVSSSMDAVLGASGVDGRSDKGGGDKSGGGRRHTRGGNTNNPKR